ncbi:MAG: HD domain-containing protein [Clostridia bacterium]|nr:HD domain-containing protein [Clostridia bacterium]
MDPRTYIRFLSTVEALKNRTRHSWSSAGRHESVAEHSWRLCLMALLCADEYPALDINKVLRMCLIHDFGEALTGDVPSFYKTDADEEKERHAIAELLGMLPASTAAELAPLFEEMEALRTPEAKLFKALDNMEAVLSHNEAPLSTWIPLEYEENLVYGNESAAWSEWTRALRRELLADSLQKLEDAKKDAQQKE